MIRRIFILIVALGLAGAGAAEQVPTSQAQISLSFVPLVKQTAPAVVNIYAKVLRQAPRSPFQGDPFFERFFQDFGRDRPRVENSLGSGVILSADGIIVSNFHVVGNATDIRVVLSDRREFEAEVLLGDAESDLAVLKLKEASDLPYLALRASDTVEVGELVLAIGNPFGVGQTVSSGIVSGLARSGASRGRARGYFIQTDAPINPGNSGGPLVDVRGALIGINTSILTRSGGSNEVGFAIPADLVKAFMAQAAAGRDTFGVPWAGMRGQAVDAGIAEAFGLDVPFGVVVSGLHPVSPFAEAGIAVGDVITHVNGQPVNRPSEMIYRMSIAGLGEMAQVKRLRDGLVEDVSVAMSQAPDTPPRDETTLGARALLEGMQVSRTNPAVISQFNLALEAEGVVVTKTGRYGRRVGLRRGDVIEAVNDEVILHPDDLVRVLRAGGRSFSLRVLRGDDRISLRFRS